MVFRLPFFGLVAACCAASPSIVSASGVPKPVVTNKTHFRIPFRFDAAALERMNARELRLYVSADQGHRWELAQTIGAESGKFEFQAPADGEYRFSVKTLDGKNQLHPAGDVYETGLIVIVDTAAPELGLELRAVAAGKVELSWKVIDSNLDASTLRLEYAQPGADDWQTVSIVPRNSGQTSWSVPLGGMVSVRGTVADLAGNQGRAQAQARVEPGGNGNAAPKKPDLRQPIAQSPTPIAEQSPITDRFTDVPHPFASPTPQRTGPALGPQPPVVEREPVAISHRTQFTSDLGDTRPEITQDRWSTTPDQPAADPFAAPVKSGGRQRIVNTKKFQIGYKIDDLGPSGLGGVDLFVTQDQGRKWWKYGEDPDQKSPFDVEVPQDGEYGFAIRARSGVGLANDPPANGESPSVVVVVDQTPPTLEMLPVRQGTGSQVNQLQLRWKISDAHPSDKPISLFYAASPNGPWETISGWRPDTGEFVWTVGAGLPSQIYFRVVARDAAGNTAQDQTPRPIIVDLSRPTARIVDIEAASLNGPQ
jgi:hypothetical protein